MTTPLIPDFIADLFKVEIQKIQENVIRQICDVYELDFEEVTSQIGFQPIKFEYTNVKISKKSTRDYGSNKPTEKCIARVFSIQKSQLYQCKRSRLGGCMYCKTHLEMSKRDTLKLGTINDPVPKNINITQHKKIY